MTIDDLLNRSEARLQEIYEAVERGEPVNSLRHATLAAIELAQFGRAFARDANERDQVSQASAGEIKK